MSFRLSQQAQEDIDAIWNYIAIENNNPAGARRVLNRFFDAFTFLAEHPGGGTAREDLRPNVRLFSPRRPAHNYVIFFYPIHGGIEISAVIHGARDYAALFLSGER
jgi:toxin ParE1/3/4